METKWQYIDSKIKLHGDVYGASKKVGHNSFVIKKKIAETAQETWQNILLKNQINEII
jgi:hypothetical protein